jgi:hypothetical protein
MNVFLVLVFMLPMSVQVESLRIFHLAFLTIFTSGLLSSVTGLTKQRKCSRITGSGRLERKVSESLVLLML